MASVTDVTIGATSTSILVAADWKNYSGPIWLKNESAEVIVIELSGSDPYDLDPGEILQVIPGQVVTGTAASGSALLQIIAGIVPVDESAAKSGGTVVAGGSVAAASGRGIWSVGQDDFTATRASDTTLTIGSLPSYIGTVTAENFALVIKTDTDGKQTAYVPTANAMTYSAPTLTVDGALFEATDLGYDVFIWGPPKSYDATVNGDQGWRLNPEWSHTAESQLVGVSLGDGTTYEYFDVETYHLWSVIIRDTPGATGTNLYTLEMTTRNDGTAQASCNYIDISLERLGKASFSSAELIADPTLAIWELNVPFNAKYIRIKSVRTLDGAATDGAYIYDAMWS